MHDRESLVRKIKKHKITYIFLLPAMLSAIIFNYLPMGGIVMSFMDYNLMGGFEGSKFVGLTHFQKFLTSPTFYSALKNTLGINFLSILIGFPLPIIFAIIVFSLRNGAFKKISQTISYLPHFISWVVIAQLVYKMLDVDTGAVNKLIELFGGEAIAFMRDPQYFWGVIITTSIWKELGWNAIIYLAALAGIDSEQYEASIVDGANGFQKLIYITIPGLMPVIGLMLIFTIGSLVNANGNVSFDAVFNLRNALLSSSANTIDYYVYAQGVMDSNVSYATAIGLTQSSVSIILVLVANKISKLTQGYGAF